MSKTYTYNSVSELVNAFSGKELYGLQPVEKYDATTFNYPIKVTVDEDALTFKVTQASTSNTGGNTSTTQAAESTSKTPIYKKWWFWVAIIGGIAVLATIIAVPLSI
jgi:hypothetical protein